MIEAIARRADCDPALLDFALRDLEKTGFACGANRNALMLREAGQICSSVDDDMICRLALPPEPEKSLALVSQCDPLVRDYFGDRKSAMEAARFVEADYCAMHERLLGRSVAACAAGAEIAVDQLSDEWIARMEHGDGRVVATFTGHVGDPGIPTSYYFLSHAGENRDRLVKSELDYRAALAGRNVHTIAPGLGIGDASGCQGTAMGSTCGKCFRRFSQCCTRRITRGARLCGAASRMAF